VLAQGLKAPAVEAVRGRLPLDIDGGDHTIESIVNHRLRSVQRIDTSDDDAVRNLTVLPLL